MLMIIREAGINDAQAIARVAVETWKASYRGIVADRYLDKLNYEERENGWRKFPWDQSFVFVAEDDRRIMGFAAAGPERESDPEYQGELYAIYVHPSEQKKGIGSRLFRSVATRFRRAGVESLKAWTFSDSPFRKFYEDHGGKAIGSKIFEMEGFHGRITAYVWLEIAKIQ